MSDFERNMIGDREISTIHTHGWMFLKELRLRTCLINLEDNNIGAVGCGYLSQADMRGLQIISLSTSVEK